MSYSTSKVERLPLQFSIVFKPMPRYLAEIVADRLCAATGDACRTKRSFQNSFKIERYTGSQWVDA